jgi:hypothetical protein
MATEAGRIDLLGRQLVEADDLGNIAPAIHVGLTWTVAALAGGARAAVLECQLRVRIVGQAVGYILVTRGACVVANIPIFARGLHRRSRRMLQSLCLGLRLGGRHAGTARGQNPDRRNQKEEHRYFAGQLPHTGTPLFGALVLLLNLLLEVGHTINTATIVQPLPSTCDLHHKRGFKNDDTVRKTGD